MNSTYHPGIHKFSLFIVAWTIVLLTAGALVTSEDAALAVPDWPLSYGSITPPMVGGIAYEHTHRVIAAGLGVLIILLAALLWRKQERTWLAWLGFAALGGVIFQGILGGLTVLKLLHYWLPVMHACAAQLEFAILVSIAVFTSRWWSESRAQYEDRGSPSIRAIAVINHSLVGIQFLLGLLALWSRISTADAPQPMPFMVASTVVHTVVGAVLFATSIALVLVCYRLVPQGREVASTISDRVPAQ